MSLTVSEWLRLLPPRLRLAFALAPPLAIFEIFQKFIGGSISPTRRRPPPARHLPAHRKDQPGLPIIDFQRRLNLCRYATAHEMVRRLRRHPSIVKD